MVDALREEPDVVEVDGTSASGVSLIFVEVDYKAAPERLKQIMAELRDVVDRVAMTLPPGTSPPDFDDEIWTEFVKIVSITGAEGRALPPAIFAVRRCFRGCRSWRPHDAPRQALWFTRGGGAGGVDEAQLSMLGIAIEEVSAALAAADAKRPPGNSPEEARLNRRAHGRIY
ncbi:MAG: hypothetical protein CM15mP84_03370 [Cellvibrionales bacterium]|nr:MAG: hypothetical protein CM15mP84_03370 [Cellvibrionales bacterium]